MWSVKTKLLTLQATDAELRTRQGVLITRLIIITGKSNTK